MPRGRAGTPEGVAAPHPRLGSIAKCSCRAGEGALVPSCASLCGPAHFCICTEVRWPGSASASAVTDGPAQGLEGCLALAEGAACPGASGGHLALRQPTPGACVRGSRCGRHAHAARSKGCSHGRGFSPARVQDGLEGPGPQRGAVHAGSKDPSGLLPPPAADAALSTRLGLRPPDREVLLRAPRTTGSLSQRGFRGGQCSKPAPKANHTSLLSSLSHLVTPKGPESRSGGVGAGRTGNKGPGPLPVVVAVPLPSGGVVSLSARALGSRRLRPASRSGWRASMANLEKAVGLRGSPSPRVDTQEDSAALSRKTGWAGMRVTAGGTSGALIGYVS